MQIYNYFTARKRGSQGSFYLTNLIITVKLCIAMLISVVHVHAAVFAQKATIQVKNESLEKVFTSLRKQTGYDFLYVSADLKGTKPVTLTFVNSPINTILQAVFEKQPVTYTIKNDMVLVQRRAVTAKGTMQQDSTIRKISGVVKTPDGNTLGGASITVQGGKTESTLTDATGKFTINAPINSTLSVSYVGYKAMPVAVGEQTWYDIVLSDSSSMLEEVVVAAMGIQRKRKTLAYSSAEISGSALNEARETNVANALTGKIAGVDATQVASGPGGSSRVVIRGNGSLNSNQQPLYVINGIPMNNNNKGGGTNTTGLNIDRGDGISSINPDDIESMTVLKSGAAAALYGSQAANGVILITTKKGAARQGIGVEFRSNAMIGTPSAYPNYQYQYGSGNDGVKPTTQAQALSAGRLSYGAPIDGSPVVQFDGVTRPYSAVSVRDNINSFYRPSVDLTNSLAFSGGSETINYRVSLSDLRSQAQTPNSTFKRKTGNLSLQSKLGKNDFLKLESTIQYNREDRNNIAGVGYAERNPSWAVYLIGNTVDINSLRPGANAEGNEIQWNPVPAAPNPWFVVNNTGNSDDRDRFIGQFSAQVDLMKNLYVRGTIARDWESIDYMDYSPIGTAFTPRGLFNSNQEQNVKTNYLGIINYTSDFSEDFGFTALLGGQADRNAYTFSAINGREFIVPNFISYTNLSILDNPSRIDTRWGTNSAFGQADFNYKSFLNLTVTGRQDWFSTLNRQNNAIFYPSVGGSFILSDLVTLPWKMNFLKLRANWAQVGSSNVGPGDVIRMYQIRTGGFRGTTVQDGSSELIDVNLKPLTVTTSEGGFEMNFFNNRLGIDATYYSRITTNDILKPNISQTSGFLSGFINAGKISNKGVELMITGTPIRRDKFRWNITYNYAYNQSKIIELAPGLDFVEVGTGISGAVRILNAVGLPYGTVRGWKLLKDEQGRQVYNATSGYEERVEADLGIANPPHTMGLNNQFQYGDFSLSFLFDAKFGAVAFNNMWTYAMRFGLTESTLPGRDNPNGLTLEGVDRNGNPFSKTWPQEQLDTYYNNRGAMYSELQTFSTDFVKLRELVFNYRIPAKRLGIKGIESANIGIVGRNLAILYRDKAVRAAGLDPEMQQTVGNATGTAGTGEPRTRNFGFNLSVTF
ncbi:SusC/RagA family TonB-linked outer membrane protein [Sphingobacterium paludis]|uniref:TonB-linked SusC/RagA family outer membrane protein n=1 Tax=Sphingobacterium paludis TaxID=1476465 RepID=A0A4R7CWW3_9SPHI|nr:SusC/RagA family TonB-linked outer membrane protein [Sphingobacterium paludis]TDS09760.1 TonB-linked SusC/RagA family outer membrane protein [Sphingobacterium paludis]